MSVIIDQFAALLVAHVRDESIHDLDARKWIPASNDDSFYKLVITESIDHAIWRLLHTIDHGIIKLYYRFEGGVCTSLYTLGKGDLAGSYATGDWVDRYGEQQKSFETSAVVDESSDLNAFIRYMVQNIRKPAISDANISLRYTEKHTSNAGKRIVAARNGGDLVAMLIADAVDQALFWFLRSIDYEEVALYFDPGDGTVVALNDEGEHEMYGWYAGNEWKKQYSKERYYDDFADIDTSFFDNI